MLKKILKYALEYALKRVAGKTSYTSYKKPYYKKRKKFRLKDLFD